MPAVLFDEQFHSGGDFDFVVRLARLGRGMRVRETLGAYYDGGFGLSTGNQLQPIERTVIELRYGIYDKLDYEYLPDALRYNISRLQWNGAWHAVADCVPDYDAWMSARRKAWFEEGLRKYSRQKVLRRPRQMLHNIVGKLKTTARGIRSRKRAKE